MKKIDEKIWDIHVKWTGESSIKVTADRADFFVAFALAGAIDNIIRPFICAVTKNWMNKKDTFCVGDCFCDCQCLFSTEDRHAETSRRRGAGLSIHSRIEEEI